MPFHAALVRGRSPLGASVPLLQVQLFRQISIHQCFAYASFLLLAFSSCRLQEICEEMRSRCPQRKRSSSLPVPKIEVSLCYNSNDSSCSSAAKNKEATTAKHQDSPEQQNSRQSGELNKLSSSFSPPTSPTVVRRRR